MRRASTTSGPFGGPPQGSKSASVALSSADRTTSTRYTRVHRRAVWRTPMEERESDITRRRLEDDCVDLARVLARAVTDDGRRVTLDAVLERYGYTRDQLRAH